MYRVVYEARKRGEICIPETRAATVAPDFLIHRKTRAEDSDVHLLHNIHLTTAPQIVIDASCTSTMR